MPPTVVRCRKTSTAPWAHAVSTARLAPMSRPSGRRPSEAPNRSPAARPKKVSRGTAGPRDFAAAAGFRSVGELGWRLGAASDDAAKAAVAIHTIIRAIASVSKFSRYHGPTPMLCSDAQSTTESTASPHNLRGQKAQKTLRNAVRPVCRFARQSRRNCSGRYQQRSSGRYWGRNRGRVRDRGR